MPPTLGTLFAPPPPHPARKLLIDAIYEYARHAPRSLQKRVGPSEVGEPCDRKLAYKLMDEPAVNFPDPWASIVGTACHTYVADALLAHNKSAGKVVWVVEHRVPVRAGLDGSCDAYHVPTGDVIDHKFVGAARLKKYRKANDPGSKYRSQAHLYGMGWENVGLPVNDVVIAFYPRTSHQVRDLYVWHEKYNRTVALEAAARMDTILAVTASLKVDETPERYMLIPKTPDDCMYCPWFRPGQDTGKTCAGDKEF